LKVSGGILKAWGKRNFSLHYMPPILVEIWGAKLGQMATGRVFLRAFVLPFFGFVDTMSRLETSRQGINYDIVFGVFLE
jgi:hypothetical protein